MNPYTHPVCAALVLTFAVSVASAQTAPAEGGGQPTPATKPAEKKPAAKPRSQGGNRPDRRRRLQPVSERQHQRPQPTTSASAGRAGRRGHAAAWLSHRAGRCPVDRVLERQGHDDRCRR